MQLNGILRGSALVALAFGLLGCAATYRNHGYTPSDADLSNVVVGLDTRASVEDTLGTPTAAGVQSAAGFFYVSETRRHFGAFRPEVTDRQLVAIRFDTDGIVENVERFTLDDGRVVALSRRVTDSNVRDTTFLRQLLGNLGRFDAGRLLGGGA